MTHIADPSLDSEIGATARYAAAGMSDTTVGVGSGVGVGDAGEGATLGLGAVVAESIDVGGVLPLDTAAGAAAPQPAETIATVSMTAASARAGIETDDRLGT